jgi:hypothetical protein
MGSSSPELSGNQVVSIIDSLSKPVNTSTTSSTSATQSSTSEATTAQEVEPLDYKRGVQGNVTTSWAGLLSEKDSEDSQVKRKTLLGE